MGVTPEVDDAGVSAAIADALRASKAARAGSNDEGLDRCSGSRGYRGFDQT
jgi:hypothetical protein